MRSWDGVISQGWLLTSAHPFPTVTAEGLHPCYSGVQGVSPGAHEKHGILASTPGLLNPNLHMAKPPGWLTHIWTTEKPWPTTFRLLFLYSSVFVWGLRAPHPLLCHFAGWTYPFPPPPLLRSSFKHRVSGTRQHWGALVSPSVQVNCVCKSYLGELVLFLVSIKPFSIVTEN